MLSYWIRSEQCLSRRLHDDCSRDACRRHKGYAAAMTPTVRLILLSSLVGCIGSICADTATLSPTNALPTSSLLPGVVEPTAAGSGGAVLWSSVFQDREGRIISLTDEAGG